MNADEALYRARVVARDGTDYTTLAAMAREAARATAAVLAWLWGDELDRAEVVNTATGEREDVQ